MRFNLFKNSLNIYGVGVKEKNCIIFFLVLILFLARPCLAAGEIDVSLNVKSLTIYNGEIGSADITVNNNQDARDVFSVSVPPLTTGITPTLANYSLTLDPKSSTTFKIYFSAAECVEETSQYATITVKSQTNPNIEESKMIILNSIRKYGVCISNMGLDKYLVSPGESVTISVSLTNPETILSLPVNLQTNVIRESEIVSRFDDFIETIQGKTTKTVQHVFTVGKYEKPGFYTVEVIMKDNLGTEVSSKKTQFNVATVNASEDPNYLTTNKAVKYGLFVQTMEISVMNEGNVPTGSFYVSESVPIFMKIFFFPKVEPNLEETKENRVVYSWFISSLGPGETYKIVYDISTWNAVLIVAVLIVTVIYVFSQVFTVSIVKKHRHVGPITKEREITVMLEARNRARNEIRDVIVRDFVPAVATVVERFDTLRPTLRKTAGGTEIVWRIDSLGSGDERILTYRIRPVVDIIGTLKLPKAYIKFMNKKKEVKRVLSKSVYIKAG